MSYTIIKKKEIKNRVFEHPILAKNSVFIGCRFNGKFSFPKNKWGNEFIGCSFSEVTNGNVHKRGTAAKRERAARRRENQNRTIFKNCSISIYSSSKISLPVSIFEGENNTIANTILCDHGSPSIYEASQAVNHYRKRIQEVCKKITVFSMKGTGGWRKISK